MQASLIIVDDFYDDPEEVRRIALGMEYPTPEIVENFPGRNSRQVMLRNGLERAVGRLVGEPVVGYTKPPSSHGRFRLSLAADDRCRRSNVHTDTVVPEAPGAPAIAWSGIVYLSLPEHCRGGTELYRHKPTGLDRAPLYAAELATFGAASYPDAANRIMNADSTDPDKWEHLMTVPMRFNRLVLLRPWLWHTAGVSFGDSLANGRLVQVFFFSLARATRRPAAL